MGDAIHGRILIVEADGKVVGNAGQMSVTPKLQNIADTGLPMAAALKQLLAQPEKPSATTFETADGEHTLFVQPVVGSPWYLATDVPTQLLEAQTRSMLTRLGLVQIPLAVLLLLVLLGFVRAMMTHLKLLHGNIESLSRGEPISPNDFPPATALSSTPFPRVLTSFFRISRG